MNHFPGHDSTNQLSRLDDEFVKLMTDIEKRYATFNKHERIRIEQWCKKLCQVSVNDIWKQNRNLYALLLLNSITEGALQEPFNKMPPEDYLPSLNKQIVRNKLESSQARLQNSELLIQESYQSPSRNKKNARTSSVGHSNSNLKVDTRALRNFSMAQLEESRQIMQNSSSIANMQSHFISSQKTPENSHRSISRQYMPPPPHSKYVEQNEQQSHRDKTEIRDIRIIQNQLEIARSTIDTLKEELNSRFMTISHLNKDLDQMASSLKQFEKEKMLFESFLTKVSILIKDGSISFVDGETSSNFLLKVNELCEILSLPRLKLKANQAFTFDSMQDKMLSTGSPKNENRLLGSQKRINQEAELQKYYEVEMKKKEPKKVSYSDKKNLRQTRPRDGLKQGEANSMIKTISYNFNQNSDYINVFQPENTKHRFR